MLELQNLRATTREKPAWCRKDPTQQKKKKKERKKWDEWGRTVVI